MKILDKWWKRNLLFGVIFLPVSIVIITAYYNFYWYGPKVTAMGIYVVSVVSSIFFAFLYYNLANFFIKSRFTVRDRFLGFTIHFMLASVLALTSAYILTELLLFYFKEG